MKSKRIGIFGGAFNPVHNGHIHICKTFLDSDLIDELWILPVFEPPHKDVDVLVPFYHRLEMVRLAFAETHLVVILDIEKDLPKPNYTLTTVEYLISRYADYSFNLCIGGDSLKYFHTWYDYKKLLKLVTLLVVERDTFSVDTIEQDVLDRTKIIRCDLTPESSSDIRGQISETGYSMQVPKEVMNYILENNLYGSFSHGLKKLL